MAEHFDGAGRPYQGPSYRGPVITAIVALVAVALAWLAYSYGLRVIDGSAALPRWPAIGVELGELVAGALGGLLRGASLPGIVIVVATVAGAAIDLIPETGPLDPWFIAWITVVCLALATLGFAGARLAVRFARGRDGNRR